MYLRLCAAVKEAAMGISKGRLATGRGRRYSTVSRSPKKVKYFFTRSPSVL